MEPHHSLWYGLLQKKSQPGFRLLVADSVKIAAGSALDDENMAAAISFVVVVVDGGVVGVNACDEIAVAATNPVAFALAHSEKRKETDAVGVQAAQLIDDGGGGGSDKVAGCDVLIVAAAVDSIVRVIASVTVTLAGVVRVLVAASAECTAAGRPVVVAAAVQHYKMGSGCNGAAAVQVVA